METDASNERMGLYRLISAVPVDLNGQGSASELLPTVGPPTSSSHSGGRVERRRIRIPFRYLFITSLLPLVALFTCVFISAVFHREHTVNTTCGEWEILPSISAAIGQMSPQKEIWKFLIYLHFPGRLVNMLMYYRLHRSKLYKEIRRLAEVTALLKLAELICLFGLTYYTSSEDFPSHKFYFTSFLVLSQLHMYIATFMQWKGFRNPLKGRLAEGFRLKTKLVFANLFWTVLATFLYFRHEWYCENGVYSLFALAEYALVVTNIAFHSIVYLEFWNATIYLPSFCC